MNWTYDGVIIGAGAFAIIGVLHPVVIRAEYRWGRKVWPAFLAAGLGCAAGSLLIGWVPVSALLAVLGFSLLWGIRELFEQEERVRRGWYPANPRKRTGARREEP